MTPRRMNVFQRVMRLWDEVHPYNAAQVLEVEGIAEPESLGATWRQTLAALGLGRCRIKGNDFHYVPDAETVLPPLRMVDPATPLEDVLTEEMNTRFEPIDAESGDICPFRGFVKPGAGSYFLGIVYHHWAADSASIRVLLREWFLRSQKLPGVRMLPLDVPRGGYWEFFGPGRARWNLSEGILHTLRSSTRFSNARQVPDGAAGFHVRYSLHPFPDGMIDALHAATRRRGVTLHDLFMAAMTVACDRHGVTPPSLGRHELALGTIVDLRSASSQSMDDIFGLFLGFTTVIVRPPLDNLQKVIRTIGSQNAWQKRNRIAQASLLRMAAGLAQAQILSAKQRLSFYRKFLPLAAGISNVNMNRSWAAEHFPSPLRNYFRVSPTGPMLPLVFTTTTLGGRFHLGLTRRDELIDDARAEALVGTFTAQLQLALAWDTDGIAS